ncbi:MAG: hypothetical protein ACLSFB_09665 [[Clostridium] scindens]
MEMEVSFMHKRDWEYPEPEVISMEEYLAKRKKDKGKGKKARQKKSQTCYGEQED